MVLARLICSGFLVYVYHALLTPTTIKFLINPNYAIIIKFPSCSQQYVLAGGTLSWSNIHMYIPWFSYVHLCVCMFVCLIIWKLDWIFIVKSISHTPPIWCVFFIYHYVTVQDNECMRLFFLFKITINSFFSLMGPAMSDLA